jgi:hypothetical protein
VQEAIAANDTEAIVDLVTLELAKQLVAPAAPVVAAPAVAASTGAKDSRKTLGKDKTKKVVRGPTYLEVPPNTTNQRARG